MLSHKIRTYQGHILRLRSSPLTSYGTCSLSVLLFGASLLIIQYNIFQAFTPRFISSLRCSMLSLRNSQQLEDFRHTVSRMKRTNLRILGSKDSRHIIFLPIHHPLKYISARKYLERGELRVVIVCPGNHQPAVIFSAVIFDVYI